MATIPFLHSRKLADGRVAWHWRPSPRLRAQGWANRLLGQGDGKRPPKDVVTAALELNEQVARFDAGINPVAPAAPAALKVWTFADLVTAYKASPEYADLAPSSRREYDSRLRQLAFWAKEGKLPVRSIDRAMVIDLKDGLLRGDGEAEGSKFKCAAMLRVLRLLLGWGAANGHLQGNATDKVPIPSPPSRRMLLTWRDLLDIGALPDADAVGLRALRIAFWSMQRREDLRQLNRMAWRELHGADPRDVPALADGKGRVMGFRLQQHKTGSWVDCPMPPFLHAEIEAAFEQSQWLFPHSLDGTLAISGDVIRRRVKPLLVAGGFPDRQLRDMRRSGMSWVCDKGADRGDVFAISGHPLDGQQRTMADVYMPPNTRKACRAIAAACRTLAAEALREKDQVDG